MEGRLLPSERDANGGVKLGPGILDYKKTSQIVGCEVVGWVLGRRIELLLQD